MAPFYRSDLREETFARLAAEASACRRCPRMEGSCRVLGPANGSLRPRLLFVAEAPGRFGAGRSGVPLSGDRSGRDFARLLVAAGLRRDEIFVTNAVLCNPRDERGRNARPTAAELHRCRPFLAATLDLLDPPLVVTLGQVALEALGQISPHQVVLARDVGQPIPWHGRRLIPLYHPGARAQIRRPLARQIEDFARLGDLLRA